MLAKRIIPCLDVTFRDGRATVVKVEILPPREE
jgi:imidazole glycerol phosphate synthase subunit HisF